MQGQSISKLEIISLSVGAIIGWGAFILPGEFFIKKIGTLNSIIGLLIGAMIMMIIEKSYQYMIEKYPVSGGEFSYTYKAFGKETSFIVGWYLLLAYLCIIPLNATAVVLVIEKVFGPILKTYFLYKIADYPIYLPEVIVSSLFIIFFSYFNIKGLKYSSVLQKIMVLFLVSIICVMGISSLFFMDLDRNVLYSQINNLEQINISNIMKVIAISPWAYIGFDTIAQVANNINFSRKKIQILSNISIIIGFIIYVLLILITALEYDSKILESSISISWATGNVVENIFGKKGVLLLGFSLLMAVTAGINGFFIATTKLMFSISKAKMLPKIFTNIDSNKIPKNIIIFLTVVSIITPWFGRKILLWITDVSSIGAAIGYMFTCFSAAKIAYLEKIKLSVFWGIIGGILGIIFSILLLVPQLGSSLTKPSYIAFVAWTLLGFIFYLKMKNNGLSKKELDTIILNDK